MRKLLLTPTAVLYTWAPHVPRPPRLSVRRQPDGAWLSLFAIWDRPLPHLEAPFPVVSVRIADGQDDTAATGLNQYVVADNGVFAHAARAGLEVTIPVREWQPETCEGLWLQQREPSVWLEHKISRASLVSLRDRSRTPIGECFKETYWTATLREDGSRDWQRPPQRRSAALVQPLEHDRGDVVADLHTHPAGIRGFSQTDRADGDGFRLHLMIENIDDGPTTVHAAVSLFGHWFEFDPSWVCDGLVRHYEEHGHAIYTL